MYTILGSAFFFGLPCWLLNMSFNLLMPLDRHFAWFKRANSPLDCCVVLRDGHRLFGDSITTFGVIVAVLFPLAIAPFVSESLSVLFIKSACVWFGSTLGSFVKRRLGMRRGAFLPIVDHGDYMIVTVAFFIAFGLVDPLTALVALAGTYFVHPIVCVIGYFLKIKSQPY